jgi:predicted HTH transcriptional regulator
MNETVEMLRIATNTPKGYNPDASDAERIAALRRALQEIEELELRDKLISSAKDGKRGKGKIRTPIYSKPGHGLPKKDRDNFGSAGIAVKNGEERRNHIIAFAEQEGGITCKDISHIVQKDSRKNSRVLSSLTASGYLQRDGKRQGSCGNQLNVYTITDHGRKLLRMLEE